jgi:hypothetical protein
MVGWWLGGVCEPICRLVYGPDLLSASEFVALCYDLSI